MPNFVCSLWLGHAFIRSGREPAWIVSSRESCDEGRPLVAFCWRVVGGRCVIYSRRGKSGHLEVARRAQARGQ